MLHVGCYSSIPGRVPLIELFNGVSLFGGRVFNITGFDAGQAEMDRRGFLLDTCHSFTTINLAKMMYRMFSQVINSEGKIAIFGHK